MNRRRELFALESRWGLLLLLTTETTPNSIYYFNVVKKIPQERWKFYRHPSQLPAHDCGTFTARNEGKIKSLLSSVAKLSARCLVWVEVSHKNVNYPFFMAMNHREQKKSCRLCGATFLTHF